MIIFYYLFMYKEKYLFLGILYSCGSIKSKSKVEFQTKRKELVDLIKEIASKFTRPKLKSGKYYTVYILDKNLNEKLGLIIKKNELPLDFLNSSERRRNFLKGYFEGKSSIYPRKNLIKISGKKEILEQLKEILSKEDISAKVYKTGKYYSLYIEGKTKCRKFMNNIGYLSEEKKSLLEKIAVYY